MKKQFTLLTVVFTLFLFACKKDKDDSKTQQQILDGKITEIIPQQYLDTLKKMGLAIHDGTKPPSIVGNYSIQPLELKQSNIPGDRIGQSFANAKVRFYDQNSSSFDIKMLGKMFLHSNDTSIKTAISGDGNNFTVYGNVKSYASNGTNHATFAILFTGTMDGSTIKNVTYGIVNVDNKNGGSFFIQEGQARLIFDSDFVSESIETFKQPLQNLKAPAEK